MTCDSVTGSVTELNLVFNYLTGTIPTEIGNLQALVELDLDGNDLTGTIPTEIGNLQSLVWLFLEGNDLTGTVPTEIGNLQALEELNLDYNDQFGRERPVPSYAPQPQPPLVLQKYTTAFTIFLTFFIWC